MDNIYKILNKLQGTPDTVYKKAEEQEVNESNLYHILENFNKPIKEASTVDGKDTKGKKRWKQTSMSASEARKKYGFDNVKVTKAGQRNGDDLVEILSEGITLNRDQDIKSKMRDLIYALDAKPMQLMSLPDEEIIDLWNEYCADDEMNESLDQDDIEQLANNIASRVTRQILTIPYDDVKKAVRSFGDEALWQEAYQQGLSLASDWPEGEGFGSSDSYGVYADILRQMGFDANEIRQRKEDGVEEGLTRISSQGDRVVVDDGQGNRTEYDDAETAQAMMARDDERDQVMNSKEYDNQFNKVMESLNEDITVTQNDPANPAGETVTVTSNVNNIDALQSLLSNAGLGSASGSPAMEPYAPDMGMEPELDGGPVMGMGDNGMAGPTDLPAMDEPEMDIEMPAPNAGMGNDDMSTFMSIVDKGSEPMDDPEMDDMGMEPELDMEPPMEERDIEHANTPDETLGTTDTLVNKLSGGLNGQKNMHKPAAGGDNPRATYEDADTADVLRGLNDLYTKYKG